MTAIIDPGTVYTLLLFIYLKYAADLQWCQYETIVDRQTTMAVICWFIIDPHKANYYVRSLQYFTHH